ncbi:DNA-binding FadR family transcriptional regulator [Novosphingobium hassiacum]|uniref:DNA-binding FadR family transcriptional regulator n=1 Tax=Novosphingobium hassiacum TaxID=173676 RepID=A0A7W5ZWW3_9SPHN|nr:GntR family transcriptional regulator [Novosphingobium hassiacum]MBB3860966.1 DNA-binding FadR family transcriptional regulator [Novosphingobium hassiacum]
MNTKLSKPVRVPKTAELVADHIRRRIVTGELNEGDFLPPEGQLIASLGISRPTLREAFRILEAEGFISVVRGSRTGARVHSPKVDAVSRYAGFVLQSNGTRISDVYEARLAFEPHVAARLSQLRPEGAVERLRNEISRLHGFIDQEDFVSFMIGVASFHRLLIELSGNRTLLFVSDMLQDVLASHQVRFVSQELMSSQDQRKMGEAGLRSFNALVNLIENGNAAGAEAHWRLHILNANKAWLAQADEGKLVDVFEA